GTARTALYATNCRMRQKGTRMPRQCARWPPLPVDVRARQLFAARAIAVRIQDREGAGVDDLHRADGPVVIGDEGGGYLVTLAQPASGHAFVEVDVVDLAARLLEQDLAAAGAPIDGQAGDRGAAGLTRFARRRRRVACSAPQEKNDRLHGSPQAVL